MSDTVTNNADCGPAYLEIDRGVAHKIPECAGISEEGLNAKADGGEMIGFVWCDHCKDREFEDREDW